MSTLNFFLPGWTAVSLWTPRPESQDPPLDDSGRWHPDDFQGSTEDRYASYCDRKYDPRTQTASA